MILVFLLIVGMGSGVLAQDRARMADGKLWMTRNVDVALPGSYCYGNDEVHCRKYGRLYGWAAARRACTVAGGGWRLPTDAEWRRLAAAYGGVSTDSGDKGRAAYAALLVGGRSGFAAVLGGGRDRAGEYGRGDAHGFYWTATEDSGGGVIYYNFGKGGLALHRQDGGEKERAFSVRCVRD